MNDNRETAKSQLRCDRVSVARRIGKGYSLRDVSFEVKNGDRVSIVGATGSGKTLLLRLISRLDTFTAGTISWENCDISQYPIRQWRREAVLVQREPKLLGMTVEDALAYPLLLQGLTPVQTRSRLQEWTQRLQIPSDWMSLSEWQLSVAQRQLVSLTRALAMEPKLLLLDEPTDAFDPPLTAYVIDVFRQVSQQRNLPILSVDRDLDPVRAFASRILYLQDGELLEDAIVDCIDWEQLGETLRRAESQLEFL